MSQQDDIVSRIRFLREGGEVLRCHTLGSPDPTYSVARHCFNMTNLLLLLHPDPSLELIKAVQWHDAPERLTGDTPAPAKWASPQLKEALQMLEDRVIDQYKLRVSLSADEEGWLKALDSLELYMWATEWIARGDNRMLAMSVELLGWFSENSVPIQVARALELWSVGRCLDTLPKWRGIPDMYPDPNDPKDHFYLPDLHQGADSACIKCGMPLSSHPMGEAPF